MSEYINFARINIEQCRKQAKELVKAHKAGDPKALDRLRWNHHRFRGLTDQQIASSDFSLADAQSVIARLHHFASWRRLLAYVNAQESNDPVIARFESAADAAITGSLEQLRAMIDAQPDLIRQRSTRSHRSTLLHYTSANGVEDYRQITPANIVEITRFLLERGAEVDATSEAYGGGSTTLGLTSTSAHPRKRGVQIELIDVLLEHGASIAGENALQSLVTGAISNGCPEAAFALVERALHVPTLYAAAGVGNIDRVRTLFLMSTRVMREDALCVAALAGHVNVVNYLLDQGVDVNANRGMSALHNATAGGHVELIKLLVARGANLEAHNEYGGTVLSSTLWFAYNVLDAEFVVRGYPRVMELLIELGARTDFYPKLLDEIAGVYERAAALG